MAECETSVANLTELPRTDSVAENAQKGRNDASFLEKTIDGLTVNDVYEIATSVGRDFEKLTDAYGGAVFMDVMPKIIKILELLESYSTRAQIYSSDAVELHASLQKLQLDDKSKTERHNLELKKVNDAWKEETRQLLHSVETLQEDNQRLVQLLSEKNDVSDDASSNIEPQSSILIALRETVEKQKDEIREKAHAIEQQAAECDALSIQAQQLTKLNVNLRRKVSLMERQATTMATQTTNLQSTCGEKDRQIKELQQRVTDLGTKLQNSSSSTDTKAEQPAIEQVVPIVDDPLLANKLTIDLNDPDRPRYTMSELQELLCERNSFKLKCFLLEDELTYYKHKDDSWVNLEEEYDDEDILKSDINDNNNNFAEDSQPAVKTEGFIQKLFASLFSHTKHPIVPNESRKPHLPHFVHYSPPFIDESDVMPAIDISTSFDEEFQTTEESILSADGVLQFKNDEED